MRALWLGAAVALLGCGDDAVAIDANVPDGPPDAQVGVHAVISAHPDVPFLPTRLDGSGSTDSRARMLSFAWHFAQVPQGSAIGDSALQAAAQTSFTGDLSGTYTVELTVSTPDGDHDTARTDVVVPILPVFYYGMIASAQSSQVAPGWIASDGTMRALAACGQTLARGTSTWDAGPSEMLLAMFLGTAVDKGFATFDPDPAAGLAGRPLCAYAEHTGGLQSDTQLFVARTDTGCPTPAPARLDDGSSIESYVRISPDGARVAWLDGNGSGPKRILTAAIDGTNRHVVRANPAGDQPLVAAAPVWRDATRLAWLESDPNDAHAFHFVQADDRSDLPPVTSLLDCASGTFDTIDEFALAGSDVIVSARPTMNTTFDLYRLSGACDRMHALTQEPAYSRAGDFQLSPDGTRILYWSAAGEAPSTPRQPGDLWIVPPDGSALPMKLVGEPGMDDYQPRWIAGGRQLVWTRLPATGDGGVGPAGLMIANADGTQVRNLIADQTGPTDVQIVIGTQNGGTACSGAPGAVGSGGVFLLLFLIAVKSLGARVATLRAWRNNAGTAPRNWRARLAAPARPFASTPRGDCSRPHRDAAIASSTRAPTSGSGWSSGCARSACRSTRSRSS